MIALLGLLVAIIFVDLTLSGDNMIIIGAAVAGVPRHQRRLAMIFGGGGAIVLRIVFTACISLLLQIPLLQALGGVIVVYVTIQLLIDRSNKQFMETIEHPGLANTASTEKPANRSFLKLLLPILLADVTTSLDNILAIGALAKGNLPVLVIGLALSVAILLLGSILVAELIERLPVLLDVSTLILAWTAAQMILYDKYLGSVFDRLPWTKIVIIVAIFVIAIATNIYLRLREKQQQQSSKSAKAKG
jgi:YjbE family integral membrane protein